MQWNALRCVQVCWAAGVVFSLPSEGRAAQSSSQARGCWRGGCWMRSETFPFRWEMLLVEQLPKTEMLWEMLVCWNQAGLHKLRNSSRFLSYTKSAASVPGWPGGALELMECVSGDSPISGGTPIPSGSTCEPALLPGLDTRGFRRSHRALFQSFWTNYKSAKFLF